MSATGIGASVKRREDIRFITGKGHYVDDINRPGQAYAFFVRSPHAHATIKQDRHVRGAEVAGRCRGVHRRRHGRRQDRRSHSRLDRPLQGWIADEGRIVPGARAWEGPVRWRSCCGRHRETPPLRRRTGPRKWSSTMTCCPRSSTRRAQPSPVSRKFTSMRPATPSSTGTSATRPRRTRPSPRRRM